MGTTMVTTGTKITPQRHHPTHPHYHFFFEEEKKMKQIKKGNKAPYNGYLLGVKEYEAYKAMKEIIPLAQEVIQSNKGERFPWK